MQRYYDFRPTRSDGPGHGWLLPLALLLLLLIGSAVRSYGQATIARAEYFVDADPGIGAATAIALPPTPASDLPALSATVPLGSLSAGFHQLGVRSQDANGQWSLTSRRTFYYEPTALNALANINKVEYFIDADPGPGAGTDVPVTAGVDISGVAFNVNLSSLSAGFHQLGVRSRDANGQWSLTNRRTFYYEPAALNALPNITKVEYFIDTDPGFAAAVDVPVTAGVDVSGVAFNVNISSLSAGFHQLVVRSQDANGQWSLTNRRTFYYEPAALNALANVTKVEYFIDAEPGFGNGIDVPVTAATDLSGVAFAVNLSSLSSGFHALSVRSRDATGKWSLTNVRSFYYEPVLAVAPNINKIEYYFDNDPGFGSATDVPVPTPAQDLANFSFAADASALADGTHRIFFRSRDATGKWSLVSSRSFVKNGCASSTNLTAGLPTSSYGSGGSVGNPPELAFNAEPATPSTSNSVYVYNGALIQADLGSAQSISQVQLKFTNSATPTNFTLQIQTAASTAGPFTTVDTYTATFNANGVYPVVRTLATPATNARVLRLVFQSTGGNYTIVTGVGAYYFNCASPSITSFTPTGGAAGTVVTLVGTNLSGATAVTFNGVPAVVSTITNNTSTGLTVTAPVGGTTGPICVTTPAGTACSAGSFAYPPAIATGAVSATAFCSSTLIQVPFSTNVASYGAGNVFNFQLSDANGVFTAGSRLYGTLISQNASGGILRDSVAFRTPAGSGYRVRVVASNPSIIGTDNGTNLTVYPTPAATATANSPVVFNGTIQLAAQPLGQSSYSWYVNYASGGTAFVGSGQTLNLANAQNTQSGLYYVYIGNASGCQDSASVRVLVQPNTVPVLAMSQFGFNGCAGATFNVGFSVTGNNFLSGNTISAQLSNASGSFAAPTVIGSAAFTGQGGGAISATIPTNTPSGTGYRIRLVGSSPAVTSNDNGSNLSITTQPTATPSSNSPVAFNGTIQLTAQTVAGATYFWTGPGFSSTQQNPTIANATLSNGGTYTLYVTVNGCQSPGTATTVVVNPSAQPILAISQFNGSLCPGTGLNIGFSVTGNVFASGNTITAQLSDASGSFAAPVAIGSAAFTGQGSGSIAATIPQGTPAGSGYRIRLIGSNPGVTSTTDNGSNLTVPTTLVATASSNSPIASGGTLQLNAGPNGAATYQWYVNYTSGGTSFISNQQNPTFNNLTTASSGFYYVFVTQGGCTDSASVRVLVNPPVTTTLALGTFSGQFCAGNNYAVNYTVSGAGLSSGSLTAQLSDASGSFAAPVVLTTINFSGTGSGSLGFTLPASTSDGTGYRIRLVSTGPALTSADNGANLTISNLTNVVAGSNSPVAAGALIQFSSSGVPAGATIAWTGPNSFSSTQPNPSIPSANAANAGTYSFTASINGCSVTRQVQVVVGAPVLALSTGTVSGSLCPGSPISVPYTVTTGSVNGGNTFTVQLSNAAGSFSSPVLIGSLSSSAASGTIAAVIPASTPAGSGYRVRVVADSPAAVGADNGANLTVGALTFAWTGGVSTDWFDGRNWSCGQVPTATSAVTIPSGGSFYPVVTGSTAALALNLTIANGATFTNNGIFNLYGNVTVNGTVLASSTSSWYFTGGITQFIYGTNPLQVGNVYITAGSTLTMNNVLNVYANWYNFGTFVGGAAYNVYFNGTGTTQVIGGTSVTTFYNAYVNNGAVVNLGLNTVFLNNFVVNGTFSAVTYGVVFGGTVAQTIGGTGSSTYYTVTVNNPVGVTLVSNITVLGDWINNGLFSGGTYSVIFAGTAAQIIGGTQVTNFYNVTFNNLISVTLHQNIYVLGGFVNTGVFYGWYLSGGSTLGYFVRFGGTAAQVINANATTYFYHFYADNAAGVSLATNIYIAGNYYLYSGSFNPGTYTVYFNGTEGPGVVQTVGGYAALSFYGWNVASTSYVRLLQNVTLLGGFANLGTFYGYNLVGGVYTGYTFTFGGSGAQGLTGGGVYEFWHVTWNNLAGITLNQNISVWGNWLNNGGFLANGYLVNFIGNVAQTIAGSVLTTFHHVTISNPVSVSLLQAVTVLGNWAGAGVFLGNGYLVYFNGSAAQTIAAGLNTRFFDLRFNNPTSVTLLSNVFLTGSWTNNGGFLANGKLVTFGGNVLQLIGGSVTTVFHHFTIATGASVRQDLGITLLGDWTNNGSFLANSLLVYFNGTDLQTIAGTALTTFYDVTFNNAVNVSLGQNIDVTRHFVNQGGYCGCGFRTRFNGTVAQSITCTSGRTHFHDITFANAAGVTLLDGIYVSGLWVNNGGYLANSQTVIFDGTALQTIGGTVLTAFYNVGITNAVDVQLLRDITVAGFWNNTGLFHGQGFGVSFNGAALQTITTTGATARSYFHHITWANLVGCVLAGDIYVAGNWLCNGPFNPATYTVYFNGTVAQSCGGTQQLRFFGLNCANPAGVTYNGPVYLLGNFVNTGLVNCGAFGWYCIGTGPQTIGGISATPTRFYDLFIQNGSGVTATDNWFLTHMLTLTTGNLASNGHLTLTSNASGTAMVVNPVGGGVVTGVSTMERFITGLSGAPGYRHYSSPMKRSAAGISTTVQEFADDLPVLELNPAYNTAGNTATPFPTFFQYDETRLTASKPGFDDGWMVPTATQDLLPLRGYTAQTLPTTTVDISGLLQTGNVSYVLGRGSLANSGWHLLGNPYPAPMDWDVARSTTGMLSGVADALYVFEPSGQYTGTYKAYVNGLGQNGGTKDLAAMQGFFVRATAPTASVSLTNAVRATSYLSPTFNRQQLTTDNKQLTTNTQKPVLRLEARNLATATADETVVYFEPGAALGFSARHDAYKVQLNGNGRPSLWSQAGTESFAINGLPDLATASVIPLGVRVSQDGAHELTLTALADAPAGTQVWLEDRVLNRRQNLAASPTYAFTMLATYTGQRFYLNFVAASPLAVTTGKLEARTALYPNPTTGRTTLELAGLREQGPVQVEVVNVLGQTVRQLSTRPKQGFLSETIDLNGLATGVYTVRIHAQEGTVVKRLVKE
ncbi:T9SS type A sorting domain-containing protein [Hymenobacter armeniacus]|uniref:T9SS type A sorting domain-containing protein n=1 Tax=Hymenobacter armeniacus TaxID=2771358 RepID=A0ABR8JNN9_9BACT|nr:T9SS type A sorting domain-containing protein [Hymenobacter armeniacus]MBD2721612.1 T9SS type A sorting domain-containing protein [Hymenobacter armeniacus]